MDRKYIAFISYRHTPLDMAVAKKLHNLIEQYPVPRGVRQNGQKRLGIVFRDQEELPASSDLSQDIRKALDNSRFLIVVCTPDTPGSRWVCQEIAYFLRNHSIQNVLTVLAAGEPEQAFPDALIHMPEGPDIRMVEPLAADVRAKTRGGVLSRLGRESRRLFAAMLGCPYDALVLREQRRRTRRFGAAACAILGVVLAFTGVLWTTNRKISRQNTELARQKREIQLSESQLLTLDAQEALSRGDYAEAAQKAVMALPRAGEEDRDYYAPAEAVLMQTLNLFGTGEPIWVLRDRVLEQPTQIQSFHIFGNGKTILTEDGFGTVTCFDTDGQKIVWQIWLPEEPLFPARPQLMSTSTGERAYCKWGNTLRCLAPEDGSVVWTQELESSAYGGSLTYDEQYDRFAYMAFRREETEDSLQGVLEIRSGATGAVLQSIAFDDIAPAEECCFAAPLCEAEAVSGAFSQDGTQYAGVYAWHSGDAEQVHINCFAVNLASGEVIFQWRQPLEGSLYDFVPVGMTFLDQGRSLGIVLQGYPENVAALVMKLSLEEGTCLWQTKTPGELQWDGLQMGRSTYALLGKEVCLAARFDGLYEIDWSTGELVDSRVLPSPISQLEAVGNGAFGYILRSGETGCGWAGNTGLILSADSLFQVATSVGPHVQAQIWGNGIVQYSEEGTLMEIAVSNAMGPGYVAAIPEEAKTQLVLKWPEKIESSFDISEIQGDGRWKSWLGNEFQILSEDRIGMGIFSKETFREETTLAYVILDRKTQDMVSTLELADYVYGAPPLLLPQGTGYIQCGSRGSVTLGKQDGTEVLAGAPEISAQAIPEGVLLSASEYQKETGSVLTVRLDTDSLCIWSNGTNPVTIRLPESLTWKPDRGNRFERFLKVCENGWVLVGILGKDGTLNLSDLIACDTEHGDWYSVAGEGVLPNPEMLAMSADQPILAAVDATHTLQVYDIVQQQTISSFSLPFPVDAGAQLDFLLNDTCLLTATENGQCWIYDLHTGDILWRECVGTGNGGVSTYQDPENARLYLIGEPGYLTENGFCLDLRSWTTLGEIHGAMGFDEETGTLYRWGSNGAILAIATPGTQELAAYAERLFCEENAD